VIDDSASDADLIANELRKSFGGVLVERVETAKALKAALQLARWDVVISDNQMPAFSGTEALQLVKASEPDLPFILVTGTMGEEAVVETLKAGVDDYVLKSNLERLEHAFERQLREAERRRERRRSLDGLRESEQRFRQLADNIDVCFYLTDPQNSRIFYANPAYEKIWGRSLDSLYADPRSWFSAVHPDDRDEMVEGVQQAAADPRESRDRRFRHRPFLARVPGEAPGGRAQDRPVVHHHDAEQSAHHDSGADDHLARAFAQADGHRRGRRRRGAGEGAPSAAVRPDAGLPCQQAAALRGDGCSAAGDDMIPSPSVAARTSTAMLESRPDNRPAWGRGFESRPLRHIC
jgi:PAS domain S-box-containing protein